MTAARQTARATWRWTAAATVLCWLPTVGCDAGAAAAAPAQRPAQQRAIQGLGRIEPVSEVRYLGFERAGLIGACMVADGQRVAADEPLMRMRGIAETAAVRLAEAELRSARAEHEKVMAGVHPARIQAAERVVERLAERARYLADELRRKEGLWSREAGSEAARDRAATDLAQTEKDLDAARAEAELLRTFVRKEDVAAAVAQVGVAEARLQQAQAWLAQTVLRAPADGTVLDVYLRPGEAVTLEDPEPALAFADDAHLRVRAEIDERFVPLLQIGQPAVVSGRNLGPARLEGRVVYIAKMMGRKTLASHSATERRDRDVLEVLIELPEGTQLPIGLRVDVELAVDRER